MYRFENINDQHLDHAATTPPRHRRRRATLGAAAITLAVTGATATAGTATAAPVAASAGAPSYVVGGAGVPSYVVGRAAAPSYVVGGVPAPSYVVGGAKVPSYVVGGAGVPSYVVGGAKAPAYVVGGAKVPSYVVGGAKAPAYVVGGAKVPSYVVGGAGVPSYVVGGAKVPSYVVGGAQAPAYVVGGARVPSYVVGGMNVPAYVVGGMNLPAYVVGGARLAAYVVGMGAPSYVVGGSSAPKGLFDGAVYARGAKASPSTGGVRLSVPRAARRGALAGKVIVVDPGHNGRSSAKINGRLVPDGRGGRKACNTTGTSTNAGYSEHAHNWAVATRLAATLRAQGATVWLTRPDDAGIGPCVDERAAIGNRAKADLVVSIHADGAAASARGFHIIRSTRMAGGSRVITTSARLATIARDRFAAVTHRPRSTYLGGGTAITPRSDIAGLNLSRVPGVMLEAGNMRNAVEAKLLASPAFQSKEATALASAVRVALGR